MATIPGWVYLVLGGAIAAYAKFVSTRKPTTALTIFFWIGIILVGVGIFKLASRYMTGQKEMEKANPREQAEMRQSGGPLTCARCNARLHPQSRYCNWCGAKQ